MAHAPAEYRHDPGSRRTRPSAAAAFDRPGADVLRPPGPGFLFVLRSRHLAPRRSRECGRFDPTRTAAALAEPASLGLRNHRSEFPEAQVDLPLRAGRPLRRSLPYPPFGTPGEVG